MTNISITDSDITNISLNPLWHYHQTGYGSHVVTPRLLQRCFCWFAGIDSSTTACHMQQHSMSCSWHQVYNHTTGVMMASYSGANPVWAVPVCAQGCRLHPWILYEPSDASLWHPYQLPLWLSSNCNLAVKRTRERSLKRHLPVPLCVRDPSLIVTQFCAHLNIDTDSVLCASEDCYSAEHMKH